MGFPLPDPGGLQKPCPDCSNKIRKAKAQLELKRLRDGMANKKGSSIGTPAAKDQDKMLITPEYVNKTTDKGYKGRMRHSITFFASVFTVKAYSQAAQVHVANVSVWDREVLSTVNDDFVRDRLIKQDLHRSMNMQETS